MLLDVLKAYVVYPACERWEGRSIRSKLGVLRQAMTESFPRRRAARLDRLAQVAAQAGATVPYYRDLFRAHDFSPARLADDARWLADLPTLTKDIVIEQGDRMLAEGARDGILHARRTGGSTGPAAMFYYSAEALDWSAAAHLLAYEWTGKCRHHSELHLSSHFPEPFPFRDRLKEWVKCVAMNRTNVATGSFSAEGLDLAWHTISRARPALLQGHPSTLYALALHLRATGRDGNGVIGRFLSTGEVLDSAKRQLIAETLGCTVYDSYGNAEIGTIAQQTEPSSTAGLKVLDAMAWPETGDDGGLLVTSLTNSAMPLLRYVTGDLATLEEREDGLYLSQIQGRIHDRVTIAGIPYPTHYVQDLLDRIGGIDEFQVMERPGQPLLLRLVVPQVDYRPHLADRVRGWWGDAVEIAFIDIADLRRVGERHKFRYKICE
jgi:phenylacetate-CoA ligase